MKTMFKRGAIYENSIRRIKTGEETIMGLKEFVKDVATVCVEEVEELDDVVFGES